MSLFYVKQKKSLFNSFYLLFEDKKLVDNQPNGSNCDGRVGHIEDGVEENEVLSAYKRHPLGPTGVDKWEVEHIDDAALQQRGIATLGWEELGHAIVALVEDEAIEEAVDKVAYGSRKDERHAHKQGQPRSGLADEAHQIPEYGTRSHKTEEGEAHLAGDTAKRYAESHALVLDKMEQAPLADERHLLANLKMRFDPDLDNLVDHQEDGHKGDAESTAGTYCGKIHDR